MILASEANHLNFLNHLFTVRRSRNYLNCYCYSCGQAALGIAHLLTMAMAKEGVSYADAVKKIWMVDSKGLIVKVAISFKPSK